MPYKVNNYFDSAVLGVVGKQKFVMLRKVFVSKTRGYPLDSPLFVRLVSAFFDLAFYSIECQVYRLFECASTLLAYDISARNM